MRVRPLPGLALPTLSGGAPDAEAASDHKRRGKARDAAQGSMLVRLPLVLGQVEGVRLYAGRVVRESELLQRSEEVDLAH